VLKRRRGPEQDVLGSERASRAGGNIRRASGDGFLGAWGPTGFLDNVPETFRLVDDLGLNDRVVRSSDSARRRFIYRGGRLHEVPTGPHSFATSGLLSMTGKLRIAGEPWAAAAPAGDETIHAFATRRIGREAADALVDPMVSGIFAGNARELSLRACFAKMADMEEQYGGLFKAMLAKMRERRSKVDVGPTGKLTSFVGGTQDLIDALACKLGPSLRLGTEVVGLSPADERWRIETDEGAMQADAVVLAGAAGVSADLVKPFSFGISSTLRQIQSAPLAVVALAYEESAVERVRGPLDGFGFLVPRGEGLRILGALWDSSVYPHRAPAGRVLIRAMVGGAHDPDVLSLSDEQIVATVEHELRLAMHLKLEPLWTRVIRHPLGIPQYTRGHLDRLAEIDRRLAAWPGLFLAGNAYRGPSINSCVADADRLADRLTGYLAGRAAPLDGRAPIQLASQSA
ncbi:MAG: protoporphyrinogen oxidase, partial [Acidobacteriota bacterium]